ncbi:MAG: lipoprotein signal peptidase [Synechococcaceae cyanobacterium RM1_1_27]|nr:lipoprotein signal peptidase [Synechococcaceae cyanobacterium SM2_3_2]NJO85908.1 lipoprotein signal peptidase [Synechococcaceae cyanobacterium RM1_1_27]
MKKVNLQQNGVFWLVAVTGILLDQASKWWAVTVLQPQFEIQLWPGVFHLTYVENFGAAWSLFENSGGFLRWISLVVTVALMAMGLFSHLSRWEQWGYGFVLAGAAGNGIDRFAQGYVVDLFNFTLISFPVFNVADVAINIGVGCLVVASVLRARAPEPESKTDPSESARPALRDHNDAPPS